MVAITLDCPWCGTKKAALEVKLERRSDKGSANWEWVARCPICMSPVLIILRDREEGGNGTNQMPPSRFGEAKSISSRYEVRYAFPALKEPEIPNSIPENVKGPLLEAEHSFLDGRYSAAGSCYRKAVERAVKAIDPNIDGMLNARIRKLEQRGLLPHAMIELLDQVRLFGNHAMHEDDIDPSKEDCAAARAFCELFLRYAFTLPAMVDAAKQKLQKKDNLSG